MKKLICIIFVAGCLALCSGCGKVDNTAVTPENPVEPLAGEVGSIDSVSSAKK